MHHYAPFGPVRVLALAVRVMGMSARRARCRDLTTCPIHREMEGLIRPNCTKEDLSNYVKRTGWAERIRVTG